MVEEAAGLNGEHWVINSEEKLERVIKELRADFDKRKYLTVKILFGKQRTPPQNRSLHNYCDDLAKALNSAGYTIAKVITKPLEISWSKYTVKDILWRSIQVALYNKESTTELNSEEVSKVYDELNRFMSERYGVHVEWRSRDGQGEPGKGNKAAG